jgi:hypothetical protein
MKNLLLTICMSGALIVASAASSPAANLPRAGEYKLSQADACQTSCKTNADSCRAQCADPEEQEQCIVGCDKGECNANCNKFEDNCKRHCPSSKG